MNIPSAHLNRNSAHFKLQLGVAAPKKIIFGFQIVIMPRTFVLFVWFYFSLSVLQAQRLQLSQANELSSFAASCITREYPNKPGHVLGSDSALLPPRLLHPAFYGCFDWHSAVHGQWTLVTLLNRFDELQAYDTLVQALENLLSRENILTEVAYFDDPHNRDFERPYGWAWLLKLDEALYACSKSWAKALHQNLQPLSQLISHKMTEFLLKLNYPIRVGEHTNVAFAMSLAYDWAVKHDTALASVIRNRAKVFFGADSHCPMRWEPGGFDFISPCLQEAALMAKVLDNHDFQSWFSEFLPGFNTEPYEIPQPAESPDRSDGKMAHLDGLNFNRAWCLAEIATTTGNKKLLDLAHEHFVFSFFKMDKGEYAGAHWLASFATMAILKLEEAEAKLK